MQHSEFYTEEELLNLYKNFIRKQVWLIANEHGISLKDNVDTTFEDIFQEACLAFIAGIRMQNDHQYPLQPFTIGVCVKMMLTTIFQSTISVRHGIKYPRHSRMAAGTSYHKVSGDYESYRDVLDSSRDMDDFDFAQSVSQLPDNVRNVAIALINGTPEYKIRSEFHLSRNGLKHIIEDLRGVFIS